ncbi:hypothetical protein GCM10028805_25350 [Spirosoma harenae]
MKKYMLALLFSITFSYAFADIVKSQPTGSPLLDTTLIVGVVAVVLLLIVRRVRKRKQM